MIRVRSKVKLNIKPKAASLVVLLFLFSMSLFAASVILFLISPSVYAAGVIHAKGTLNIVNAILNPDGHARSAVTAGGSTIGPLITAQKVRFPPSPFRTYRSFDENYY